MASHLASLWKWDFWNSEMAYYIHFTPKNLYETVKFQYHYEACKLGLNINYWLKLSL